MAQCLHAPHTKAGGLNAHELKLSHELTYIAGLLVLFESLWLPHSTIAATAPAPAPAAAAAAAADCGRE